MVRFVSLEEMKQAIEFALEDKKKSESNQQNTIIRLAKNRSLKIERLPPEEAIRCALRSFPTQASERDYRVYFPDE